ncbi:MAG: sigma-54-dependent Fis family transcriptional regulator [Vicinamibacteria bacterium]|nr:sigma-54-dependent Fis family transcriptional regulator [Vicinamibacteria bacterium]
MSERGAMILLVDDDPAVLQGVSGLLRDEGYRTAEARNVAEAVRILRDERDPPDLVLLDIRMPGESGLVLMERLGQPPPLPIVVLSGEASISDTVSALKMGATDFVEKPPSPERLLTAVRNALALDELRKERERLREELSRPGHLVGGSQAMEELRRLVTRVGPSNAIVLVTGETGTGKERVARALHLASGRKGRFVGVNCAAIPAALLESEIFGYERGAFSGAVARHLGRIEQAHGGTLLLDEIGDMPLDLQAKLLRVIEERAVERLGGTAPVPVNARVVASTHRDIKQEVADGRFREDLYYRLNVFPIVVPPLRERIDDIRPLARAFAADLVGPNIAFHVTPEAEALLGTYDWPGNVRELRNLVERFSLLRPDESEFVIDTAAVAAFTGFAAPTTIAASKSQPPVALDGRTLRELIDDHERRVLRAALSRCAGNIASAARLLGVDRGNLHRRLRALDVPTTAEQQEKAAKSIKRPSIRRTP